MNNNCPPGMTSYTRRGVTRCRKQRSKTTSNKRNIIISKLNTIINIIGSKPVATRLSNIPPPPPPPPRSTRVTSPKKPMPTTGMSNRNKLLMELKNAVKKRKLD